MSTSQDPMSRSHDFTTSTQPLFSRAIRFHHHGVHKNLKIVWVVLLLALPATGIVANDGAFVRFKLSEPEDATYHLRLRGFIHNSPWYLPPISLPENPDETNRFKAGEFTPWFDLKTYGGEHLHGRLNRAGGIAEFPNIAVWFVTDDPQEKRLVEIELATAADDDAIVKRWNESFSGEMTSFLVSPNLAQDAEQLEIASEMTQRRMNWAMEASGGQRVSPQELILQTGFWSPQRPELNLQEGKIVSLLGFNMVSVMPTEVREAFPEFKVPNASHAVSLKIGEDEVTIRSVWDTLAARLEGNLQPGAPMNFGDEITAAQKISGADKATQLFQKWLEQERVDPSQLGVDRLDQVVPIDTPDELKERMKLDEPAARRIFYYSSRFRQQSITDRLAWNTDEMHRRLGPGPISSTLVADHPYFGGTGLGMGMDQPNTAWGGWPLAADWFEIGRRRAVDMIGIEDWMGLQFMYGPGYTWEGFQLMGFQASIFRSASEGELPIISWITPSDEVNLRLKAASALAQGSKHLFYWTYGPTATSTENYWADQPGSYPGMVHVSRSRAFGEPLIAPGTTRSTRVALLYSISSDLWQPFGYAHMLDRRGLYLSLVHDQFLVDLLSEEDITEDRLSEYDVLYSADPCISESAQRTMRDWVAEGGILIGTCAAGSRNEFGEPTTLLNDVFGIERVIADDCQEGEYRIRGRLNDMEYRDHATCNQGRSGCVGVKVQLATANGKVVSRFDSDGLPARVEHSFGEGTTIYFASSPGIGYIKDAKFVPDRLAESWPAKRRHQLNAPAREASLPLVKLSQPVVEAGIYDAPGGSALVLANFTYEDLPTLTVQIPMRKPVAKVQSFLHGELEVKKLPVNDRWSGPGLDHVYEFELPLKIDDVILLNHEPGD